MAYWILRKTIIPIIRALFIKQITGIERLPKKGAFIIALNHSSYIDGAIVAAVLLPQLKKPMHFIAMKPLKKYWISRIVLGKYFGSIFVNGAVDEAVTQLKKGEVIIIFPEGGRTPDGKIRLPAGSGTAIMSALSNAPVIPAAITGTFEVWPRQKTLPRIRKIIKIHFGNKIAPPKRNSQEEIKKYMNRVMHSIAKLYLKTKVNRQELSSRNIDNSANCVKSSRIINLVNSAGLCDRISRIHNKRTTLESVQKTRVVRYVQKEVLLK